MNAIHLLHARACLSVGKAAVVSCDVGHYLGEGLSAETVDARPIAARRRPPYLGAKEPLSSKTGKRRLLLSHAPIPG